MKPGYKSTEFWLSFAAILIGALLAGDFFAEGSQAVKVLAFASSTLAALGYTAARAFTKAADAKKEALTTVAALEKQ